MNFRKYLWIFSIIGGLLSIISIMTPTSYNDTTPTLYYVWMTQIGHHDAEPTKFTGGADAQLLKSRFIEVGGVGIEAGQHAANGIFQQFLVADLFHEVLFDAGKDFGEAA